MCGFVFVLLLMICRSVCFACLGLVVLPCCLICWYVVYSFVFLFVFLFGVGVCLFIAAC